MDKQDLAKEAIKYKEHADYKMQAWLLAHYTQLTLDEVWGRIQALADTSECEKDHPNRRY